MKQGTGVIGSTLGRGETSRGLSIGTLAFVLALYLLWVCNLSFLRELNILAPAAITGTFRFIAAMGFFWMFAYAAVLSLLLFRGLGKPLTACLLLLASIAAYAADSGSARLDGASLSMFVQGDIWAQVRDLPISFWLWFFGTGCIPALILLWVPVARRPLWSEVFYRVLFFGITAGMACLIFFTHQADFDMAFARPARLRTLLSPVNVITAVFEMQSPSVAMPKSGE